MTAELFKSLAEAIVDGNIEIARRLVNHALGAGVVAQEILDKALFPGMGVVGQRFKDGEAFIPEVLFSARTMQAAMEILRPRLTKQEAAASGTVVIGTVQGDIHSIGKNLVAMMMEGAGFKVIDLGVDVKPQGFAQAARDHQADIVAMSALLTTTMPNMAATVAALKEAGLRDRVRVMAGGAPVSDQFVRQIGADAYGSNAGSAVDEAKRLLSR